MTSTELAFRTNNHEKELKSPMEAAIVATAAARDLSLEPQRLRQLVAQVEYRQRLESVGVESRVQFEDNFNHVRVQRHELSDQPDKIIANVDFTPILDDDDDDLISGATVAGPEHATEITIMGIRGMQNYALLVEAGLIEKPDILYAETNPTMAITAERMGLLSDTARQQDDADSAHEEMRKQKKLAISGTFEEVSSRLFSPETQRLERLLIRRQSTRSMAQVALNRNN